MDHVSCRASTSPRGHGQHSTRALGNCIERFRGTHNARCTGTGILTFLRFFYLLFSLRCCRLPRGELRVPAGAPAPEPKFAILEVGLESRIGVDARLPAVVVSRNLACSQLNSGAFGFRVFLWFRLGSGGCVEIIQVSRCSTLTVCKRTKRARIKRWKSCDRRKQQLQMHLCSCRCFARGLQSSYRSAHSLLDSTSKRE